MVETGKPKDSWHHRKEAGGKREEGKLPGEEEAKTYFTLGQQKV